MADKVVRLHELLAVEGQLKGQAETTRKELAATFDKKRHLFEEKVVVFTPADEGKEPVREQQSSIMTTVKSELGWITGIWAKALDTSFRVQQTCQSAKADVILEDGTVLLKDAPVLALLELEKRCTEMGELAKQIPTLDGAKGFVADEQRGKGYFRALPRRTFRTKKEQTPIVLYPATPEHPAQTQLITQDVVTGVVQEQEWSAFISSAEKGDIIARVEELQRAVKKARMRANLEATPDETQIGAKLLNFVFTGARS